MQAALDEASWAVAVAPRASTWCLLGWGPPQALSPQQLYPGSRIGGKAPARIGGKGPSAGDSWILLHLGRGQAAVGVARKAAGSARPTGLTRSQRHLQVHSPTCPVCALGPRIKRMGTGRRSRAISLPASPQEGAKAFLLLRYLHTKWFCMKTAHEELCPSQAPANRSGPDREQGW